MPIYQYACENCGHQKEAIQKISDPVLVDCSECNEPGLRKQVTAAAFRLKGTGWYETDFKGSKKDNSDKNSADKQDANTSVNEKSTEKTDKSSTASTVTKKG